MLNYIHADIKRILTQKKFIKFGLILLLLFEALIFLMNTHNFTSSRYLTIIAMSLEFMPLVIGIFIFSIVYLDDLHSKSIQTAIGFGFKRSQVIIVKSLNIIIISTLISVLIFGAMILTGYIYRLNLTAQHLMTIFKMLSFANLKIFLFSSLASLVVYGVQKISSSITVFILLVTQTLYLFSSMLLNQNFIIDTLGNISKYLPSELLSSLNQSVLTGIKLQTYVIPGILLYFALSFIGSTLLFRHKELEF